MKNYYVYILASRKNGTLYVGITSNLPNRIYQHKTKQIKGFTEKYNINKLVYYEQGIDFYNAASREKQLKKWKRQWKIELIERENPNWKDLYYDIIQ
jgi:putative endonuclease